MRLKQSIKLLIAGMFLAAFTTMAQGQSGKLSGNQRISSAYLGYDLQYRVYTPHGAESMERLPTIYLTDGQGYIKSGGMKRVLNKEIKAGRIKPVVAVFVDARDPDNLYTNRRNSQFFCNRDYLKFFVGELVPKISVEYPVSLSQHDRVIMGLSFGGLNAACFGLMAPSTFGGIAMQSPAIHPVPMLRDLYASEDTRPIKIFFSTGRINDNVAVSRDFKSILENKGYDLFYKEVNAGHTWRNWKPLLDDVLQHFFPAEP